MQAIELISPDPPGPPKARGHKGEVIRNEETLNNRVWRDGGGGRGGGEGGS